MSCALLGVSKHRLCANRDKSGAEIQGGKHLPTGVQLATNHYQNSNAWLEGTCTFVAEPLAAAFRVYAGQTAGTGGGYVNPSKGEHGHLQSTLLAGRVFMLMALCPSLHWLHLVAG